MQLGESLYEDWDGVLGCTIVCRYKGYCFNNDRAKLLPARQSRLDGHF